jgi:hypothetical protein
VLVGFLLNKANMENKYPIDDNAVDKDFLEQEELYEVNIERNVQHGVVNPRFVRWFKEDNRNDEPVDDGNSLKKRYRICSLCEEFDPVLKLCSQCKCFMPIKVQFKKMKCPIGKWDSIT